MDWLPLFGVLFVITICGKDNALQGIPGRLATAQLLLTGSLSSHGDHPLPSFLAALLSHFWSPVRGLVSAIFIESQFC